MWRPEEYQLEEWINRLLRHVNWETYNPEPLKSELKTLLIAVYNEGAEDGYSDGFADQREFEL